MRCDEMRSGASRGAETRRDTTSGDEGRRFRDAGRGDAMRRDVVRSVEKQSAVSRCVARRCAAGRRVELRRDEKRRGDHGAFLGVSEIIHSRILNAGKSLELPRATFSNRRAVALESVCKASSR